MIYAIGDIHGEIWKLRDLLEQIEARASDSDRLVFVGDYIDRGPDSCGVIELLLQVKAHRPQTIFLRGNHEQEMLDSRTIFESRTLSTDFEQAANWFAMGGAETMASYPRPGGGHWFNRVPDEHWIFLRGTGFEHREGGYLFVHAGVVPSGYRYREGGDPRLWIREPFLSSHEDFGEIVVFGHTPQRTGRPLIMNNKIGIDTAATFGGPLTAVALDPTQKYDPDQVVILQSR